jgi:hypothetical protein
MFVPVNSVCQFQPVPFISFECLEVHVCRILPTASLISSFDIFLGFKLIMAFSAKANQVFRCVFGFAATHFPRVYMIHVHYIAITSELTQHIKIIGHHVRLVEPS